MPKVVLHVVPDGVFNVDADHVAGHVGHIDVNVDMNRVKSMRVLYEHLCRSLSTHVRLHFTNAKEKQNDSAYHGDYIIVLLSFISNNTYLGHRRT